MQKTKLVFNQAIAGQLRDKGYVILTTLKNKNDTSLDVFVFERTDNLLKDLKILINK